MLSEIAFGEFDASEETIAHADVRYRPRRIERRHLSLQQHSTARDQRHGRVARAGIYRCPECQLQRRDRRSPSSLGRQTAEAEGRAQHPAHRSGRPAKHVRHGGSPPLRGGPLRHLFFASLWRVSVKRKPGSSQVVAKVPNWNRLISSGMRRK